MSSIKQVKRSKINSNSIESSHDVFMKYVEYGNDGTVNCSELTGKACYNYWLITRLKKPQNPSESFRRALTAHCRGDDGRQPFPQEVEIALIKHLKVKSTWKCFEGTDVKIGVRGYKAKGYHEKQKQDNGKDNKSNMGKIKKGAKQDNGKGNKSNTRKVKKGTKQAAVSGKQVLAINKKKHSESKDNELKKKKGHAIFPETGFGTEFRQSLVYPENELPDIFEIIEHNNDSMITSEKLLRKIQPVSTKLSPYGEVLDPLCLIPSKNNSSYIGSKLEEDGNTDEYDADDIFRQLVVFNSLKNSRHSGDKITLGSKEISNSLSDFMFAANAPRGYSNDLRMLMKFVNQSYNDTNGLRLFLSAACRGQLGESIFEPKRIQTLENYYSNGHLFYTREFVLPSPEERFFDPRKPIGFCMGDPVTFVCLETDQVMRDMYRGDITGLQSFEYRDVHCMCYLGEMVNTYLKEGVIWNRSLEFKFDGTPMVCLNRYMPSEDGLVAHIHTQDITDQYHRNITAWWKNQATSFVSRKRLSWTE